MRPESKTFGISLDLLDVRERGVLERRSTGQTLDAIGRRLGLTGERVRQISRAAEARLITECDARNPSWRAAVGSLLDAAFAVSDVDLSGVLIDVDGLVLDVLVRAIGAVRPRFWGRDAPGYWTAKPAQLQNALTAFVANAPYQEYELGPRAEALGIPLGFPLETLLGSSEAPLVRAFNGAWVRRRFKRADSAYLWLLDEGEERRAEEIADAQGDDVRGVTVAMRKDDRFRQILPERTWSLTTWASGGKKSYAGALDAVLEVLTERGPVRQRELFAEVTNRYPVSRARLRQCLLSDQVGFVADGRLDLVERGAVHVGESEPRRPDNMVGDLAGNVLGVTLTVDADMVRGSGIPVHNWLTWHLGMRSAPMKKSFNTDDGHKPLIVSRNTGGAQLSTLRARVTSLGMVEGCRVVIMFRVNTSTASVSHACDRVRCPIRHERFNR